MFIEIENKIFDLSQAQLDSLNNLLAETQAINRKWSGEDYEYNADYNVYKLRAVQRTEWKIVVNSELGKSK